MVVNGVVPLPPRLIDREEKSRSKEKKAVLIRIGVDFGAGAVRSQNYYLPLALAVPAELD